MNRFRFLALCASLWVAAQANELSMPDAWQQILIEHAGIASDQALVNAQQAKVSIAKSQRLPSLSLSSRFNVMDDEVGIWFDTSALMPGGQPVYIPVQDKSFFDTDLTLTLPIFTGGRIQAGIDASEAELWQQQARNTQALDDLFLQFVKRYFSVNLTAESMRIRKLALDNLEQHLHRATRQHQEGTVAFTTQLQAQVERDKAHREWRNASTEHELAISAFQVLFASDVSLPKDSLTFIESSQMQQAGLVQQAINHHSGRQQILAQQAKVTAAIKAVNAQFLPTIALFAQTELATNDLTELDPQWTAGINLQWHLFGQGNRFKELQQYQALDNSAQLKLEQAEKDIAVLVAQKLTAIHHAEESYLALNSSVQLAEENLRMRRAAFSQGLGTSLDEIDAQLLLTGLQLEQQKLLFDYYLSLAQVATITDLKTEFLQLF